MTAHAERIGKLVDTYGAAQLDSLEHLGGANLRSLARTLWMGFGLHTGDDIGIARYLAPLPMTITPLPTFVYTRFLFPLPLFELGKNSRDCMPWPYDDHLRTRIRHTRIIDLLLDGAIAIHAGINVHEDRERMLLHLVHATTMTAHEKGLQ